MNLVEIIGNQHLRILSLEEACGQLKGENSQLKEKLMRLAPKLEGLKDENGHLNAGSSVGGAQT